MLPSKFYRITRSLDNTPLHLSLFFCGDLRKTMMACQIINTRVSYQDGKGGLTLVGRVRDEGRNSDKLLTLAEILESVYISTKPRTANSQEALETTV